MLLTQLIAIIIYSSWHYARVFHDNQNEDIDFNTALTRVVLILLMSYLLYSWTTLFFAITISKLVLDLYTVTVESFSGIVAKRYKWDFYDSLVGLLCFLVYCVG